MLDRVNNIFEETESFNFLNIYSSIIKMNSKFDNVIIMVPRVKHIDVVCIYAILIVSIVSIF